MHARASCLSILLVWLSLAVGVANARQKPDVPPEDLTTTRQSLSEPGPHVLSIFTARDKVRRWYTVYTPRLRKEGMPLVFALHGAHGGMRNMVNSRKDLRDLADERSFVVVFPNGQHEPIHKTGKSFWNAGFCCGEMNPEIDDVAFISDVATHLTAAMKINRNRIHIIGFSNGGMLAQRIAATHPQLFASVVSMGAVPGYFESPGGKKLAYPAAAPIPVLLMHGTDDNTIPFAGGTMTVGTNTQAQSLSYREALAHWSAANHCEGSTDRNETSDGGTPLQITSHTGCDADVLGIAIKGFGHKWVDASHAGFNGTLRAIEFLEAHPKRGS